MGGNILFSKRHPAQLIALISLLFVGTMQFIRIEPSGWRRRRHRPDGHNSGRIRRIKRSMLVLESSSLCMHSSSLKSYIRTLAATLGGLMAVIALNHYSVEEALSLKAVTTMIDWETIGLLLGMMVMVGIISHTGVFEWFAVQAYKKSGGEIWTLVVILCSVTAVLSAFLDNVTTMLLLTPVTIKIAQVLDLKPIPILISEVLFSNIGGAATMIGDPPNIMIGSAMSPDAISGNSDENIANLASDGVTFNDFITEMAPGILMTIVPSFMLIRWLYKDEFSGRRDRDITELERQYAIKDVRGIEDQRGNTLPRDSWILPPPSYPSCCFMGCSVRGSIHAFGYKPPRTRRTT